MLFDEIEYIKTHTDECRTLVIDTVDWAELLCVEHICAVHNKKGIEDFGYGNGYVYTKEEFGRFLNKLSDLIEVGINVVLTAHAQLRKFEQPDELGAYDRWELKLGKKTQSQTSPLVKEWADMLLFANYKTFSVAVGKDGKKHKGQGGKRTMYTQHHPCWDAKNRFGLPEECEFDYSVIAEIIEGTKKSVPAPKEEKPIEIQKPSVKDNDFMNIPKDTDEKVDFDTGAKVEEPVKSTGTKVEDSVFHIAEYIPKALRDKMHRKEFKTVNKYLNDCYDKAFTGNMYVLHGEGIPLIVPIDQEKVVRAVQVNSKISKGLYSRLGEDVDLLKRKITAQISRGVATGMSYSQMAQQLAGYTKTGYNNAVRITRTEGHRIQQKSTMDACYAARERGADVVKQWDATMDANTRESHQMVDGEIRELDEKFSNGLMYPGDPSGNAAEVINCRCILLQRAKWALDQKELDRLKERASFYGLDKTKSFDEFNKKYIGTVENSKGNKIKMDLQFFAKIPDEKLTEYALNFEHPTGKEKAKAFKEALGYTKESYTDLKTKILDSFDEKELVYKREDKYGKRYEQIMQITGPNGKTANVLTAWIKDNDNAEPRLTSIYVDKR